MPSAFEFRCARVKNWLARLRPLQDPAHDLGRMALVELPRATGLSDLHVAWALSHAFETNASDADIANLVSSVDESPTAHVILSANVFVAALRAIALALASSDRVQVRPSTREPVTAALMLRAAPDSFQLVSSIRANAGDHVWAYGADATLARLRVQIPRGVVLHGHGTGYGVLLVDAPDRLTVDDYDAIALDVAAFDQRGCLSPRVVLLMANREQAKSFALSLLDALNRINLRLPIGVADDSVISEVAQHVELWRYLGYVYSGPGGRVTLDIEGLAPGRLASHRTLHVRTTADALADLVGLSDQITAVGSRAVPALAAEILERCPKVRWSPFGQMQSPKLDGPVDRRIDPKGWVI